MILEENETFVVRGDFIDGCLLHVCKYMSGWTAQMSTLTGSPLPYWAGGFATKLDAIEAFFRHRPTCTLERRNHA